MFRLSSSQSALYTRCHSNWHQLWISKSELFLVLGPQDVMVTDWDNSMQSFSLCIVENSAIVSLICISIELLLLSLNLCPAGWIFKF